MSHICERSASRTLLTLVMALLALVASSCAGSTTVGNGQQEALTQSATTIPDAAEPVTQPAAQPDAAAPVANAVDCVALHEARQGYQGAGGSLTYVDSPEFFADFIGDVEALRADVELFRPYQDIDAVPFGPIREGLDNFSNDLTAAEEGRYQDIVGEYKPAGMNGLLAEIGC